MCHIMLVTVRIMVVRKTMLMSAGENECRGRKISKQLVEVIPFLLFPKNVESDGILCSMVSIDTDVFTL